MSSTVSLNGNTQDHPTCRKSTVLLTGGAGFIGSHTFIELVKAGYDVVVVDNYVNSCPECLKRVSKILSQSIISYNCNILDKSALDSVFDKHKIEYVIHFAGLKAVGESSQMPLTYYKNNLGSTITLLEVMKAHGVNKLIFSSSATVYGAPQYLPMDEKHPVGGCTNPYGKTKFFIEEILHDLCIADKSLRVVNLRYFNPVGAHESGLIGEDPQGPPNNLMPYVAQVAVGRLSELKVFGNDYPTPDGTGVRDYIHVVDLALGHVAALPMLEREDCGFRTYNLGTGRGYSVLEMITAFEEVSGIKVVYKIVGRRAGDVANVYADVSLAEKELGWRATRDLKIMCQDLWRWQSKNPQGFQSRTPCTSHSES